jgi:hypothetical protein
LTLLLHARDVAFQFDLEVGEPLFTRHATGWGKTCCDSRILDEERMGVEHCRNLRAEKVVELVADERI